MGKVIVRRERKITITEFFEVRAVPAWRALGKVPTIPGDSVSIVCQPSKEIKRAAVRVLADGSVESVMSTRARQKRGG